MEWHDCCGSLSLCFHLSVPKSLSPALNLQGIVVS